MRLNWLSLLFLLLLPLTGCAELKTLRERNSVQEQTIAQLRKENTEFQAAYYKIKETLDNELAKTGQESDRLKRELDQATNLKSAKEKELEDQLRTRSLELEAQTREAAAQKQAAETLVAELRANIDLLTAERETALRSAADLDTQLKAERLRTAELDSKLAAAQVEGNQKTERIAALETALGQAGEKLKTTEAAQAAAEGQAKDLQEQMAALQKDLDATRAQAAQAEALEKQRAELAAQVDSLRAENQKATEAAAAPRKAPSLADDAQLTSAAATLKGTLPEGGQLRLGNRGLRIIIPSDRLFDPNSVTLIPTAADQLGSVIGVLKTFGDREVTVEGHTDDQPIKDLPYADNWGLGAARADRIRELLLAQGVGGANLASASRGEASPLGDNKTAEGRAKNRRIEIIIGAPKGD